MFILKHKSYVYDEHHKDNILDHHSNGTVYDNMKPPNTRGGRTIQNEQRD